MLFVIHVPIVLEILHLLQSKVGEAVVKARPVQQLPLFDVK